MKSPQGFGNPEKKPLTAGQQLTKILRKLRKAESEPVYKELSSRFETDPHSDACDSDNLPDFTFDDEEIIFPSLVPQHSEELQKSAIASDIIRLNFKSLT
ncbi:MAG: hypothetical protein AAFY76_01390, partial [Cyanobacteria bacterium J06649_11]